MSNEFDVAGINTGWLFHRFPDVSGLNPKTIEFILLVVMSCGSPGYLLQFIASTIDELTLCFSYKKRLSF